MRELQMQLLYVITNNEKKNSAIKNVNSINVNKRWERLDQNAANQMLKVFNTSRNVELFTKRKQKV